MASSFHFGATCSTSVPRICDEDRAQLPQHRRSPRLPSMPVHAARGVSAMTTFGQIGRHGVGRFDPLRTQASLVGSHTEFGERAFAENVKHKV